MSNIIDNCKNCGCTQLEHNYCTNNNLYRHIDDKEKMKQNLKSIKLYRSGFLEYTKFFKESIYP